MTRPLRILALVMYLIIFLPVVVFSGIVVALLDDVNRRMTRVGL